MKEKSASKRIVLLDAHAIIHRAYHALPEFSNTKGEPTGALFGISTMLMKIIGELKPDYIIACYDMAEKTFRHDAYEAYKGGRKKADDALVAQIIRSKEIFIAFGIPIYEKAGFEADDILGTIVEQLHNDKDAEIIIASGDMDTMQLVDKKKVQVYTLKKGINDTILYDEKSVVDRFGFIPKLLPDYKGLRGDPSDNIIGIQGIGEKTATTLIVEFGTIENIYKALKKNKIRFKEIGITDRIVGLLEEGEEEALFSKTLAQIRRDAPIDFKIPKKLWKDTVDSEKVKNLFKELEFKSLFERFMKLLGEDVEKEIVDKEEINEEELEKVGIALWLLKSDLSNPTLEDILDYADTKKFEHAKEKILKELEEKNLIKVYEEIELPIYPIVKEMEQNGILIDKKYFQNLSEDYHSKLSKLETKIWEYAGGEFNINSPKQLGEVLFDKLQLTAKGLKKSEGGARSTRVSELEKLRGLHPVIDEITSYRELQKLLSTYIDPIPLMVGVDGRLHAKFIQAGTTTGRFASTNPNLQNIPTRTELGSAVRKGFVSKENTVLLSFDYSQIELRVLAILSEDEFLSKVFEDGKDIHSAVASRVFGVEENDVTSDMRRQAKVINFGIVYGMGITALKENLGTTRAEAEKFHNNYFQQFPKIGDYLEELKNIARAKGYSETLFGRRRYFPEIRSSIPFIKAMAERTATNAPIQGTAADIIKLAIRFADESLIKNKLKDKTKLLMVIHDELVYEVEEGYIDEVTKVVKDAMEEVLERSFIHHKTKVPITVNYESGDRWGELK